MVTSTLLRWALALGLLLAVAGCGGGPRQDRVTIMIPWSGDEFQAFYSVIRTFEQDTGIQVDVQATRALTQQLDAAVAAGAPPDLAMLPSVGAINEYAGKGLKPLAVSTTSYVEPFRGLTKVGRTTYAVPVKVDVKSLVWFDPEAPERPPTSPLSPRRAATWCLGLESGPTSGWPGADWIADILLADGDGTAYRRWLSGELKWNSPEVHAAWTRWRRLVDGSLADAPTRNFSRAAEGMTADPPTCSFAHGALSAMGFPDNARYDFVASSDTRRLEVSADFVGMFTDDNPSAEALITYLADREAQQSWVNQRGGYAFSAHSQVTRYDHPVQRRIAKLLRPRSGHTLCFGAADAMRPDVSAAFYRAVLTYATNPDAGDADLRALLTDLDAVQNVLGDADPDVSGKLCATLS
ncbi:extracellular solute-binding protein family 1 [Streptomyces lincolnensis]|uniref:Extracellular solute-binding protein family 1 n=1 Tax=Streptomyces lincolnensis TaxID=1915 RepID=A0A1B1M7Z5_STRLN|nr:extracellular solute-binding protein [Streptomyces lincolnensis]ANS64522.1 extracellular solute-binding protein family 1 [Streptomyces lincolnensis]AXG57270.1 extracellular solute-binding protein family 1 [Streptomyces lincolnensis]QMV06346.1 extracellular solute-binding protein [Streptomyces lincolnensis]